MPDLTDYATKGYVNSAIAGIAGCFAKGTKILLASKEYKNIEDIKIGDYVYSYNQDKQIYEVKRVIKAYCHHNTPRMVEVIFANGTILKMTPGHPLLSKKG